MADRKRDREETEVETAVQEIEASLGRDADMKIKALAGLTHIVDTSDEGYAVQREAAETGALTVLMQLLEDDSDVVRIQAAKALTVLTQHSRTARARMAVGKTTGFSHTPEKVALNPVQESVQELDGVFNLLTNMRFSDNAEMQAAGSAALSAVCSLNRDNTVAALRELVHRLLQHEPKALLALEDMLAGLDVRDDMAVLLDQALSPALSFLRSGSGSEKLDAATLLGSICEKRPGAAGFLVAEGALPAVSQLLVSADTASSDAAARTLWLLVKDNRRLLSPAKGALGTPGTQLVDALLALVEARGDADDDAANADGDDEGDDEGEEEEGGKAGGGKAGGEKEGKLAVEFGDEALLLLRALAAQDGDVKEQLAGQSEILGSRCTIM
uniref:UNC-45/Cro1/She4 central domain-containing protein n=1 Tax=Tetradesmus obliquus TaxID=3088 RepID=A0A383V8G1_TETOB|eukprot:jgi/Sobl393_1/8386/SZX61253.1